MAQVSQEDKSRNDMSHKRNPERWGIGFSQQRRLSFLLLLGFLFSRIWIKSWKQAGHKQGEGISLAKKPPEHSGFCFVRLCIIRNVSRIERSLIASLLAALTGTSDPGWKQKTHHVNLSKPSADERAAVWGGGFGFRVYVKRGQTTTDGRRCLLLRSPIGNAPAEPLLGYERRRSSRSHG